MPGEAVRIDELRLRVPGLSAEEGRALGTEVARRISEALPQQGRAEHLGALEVRLAIPAGTPANRLAERVAEEIAKRLR